MELKGIFKREDRDGISLNSTNLKESLGGSDDVIFSSFQIGEKNSISITLLFIEGMVDVSLINNFILKPLITDGNFKNVKKSGQIVQLIESGQLYFASHMSTEDIDICTHRVMSGDVALIFDDIDRAIIFDVKGFDKRPVSEPSGENVLKGSKDTFIEVLTTNTALVRRKVKTSKLRIKQTIVGRQTLTEVAIIYIDGLTNEDLVEEVVRRIEDLDIDGVLTAGNIEEYIIDNKITAFPLIDSTERTDKFCSNIVSGRVGVFIDGLPKAFIVPGTLNQFMQAPEDYAQNFIFSSAIRLLRYFLLLISIGLPAFYVALISFHQEMIPTELAIAIAISKRGVPFPSFIEILAMLIAFEILVEAGIRLPQSIGNAISILGALVIGEAAVSANIVSPGIVIIIALTGISTFTMPNTDLSNGVRIWRFILTIFSSIAGLFGLTIGTLALLMHLCSIETFGIPYLSPYIGQDRLEYKDTFLRLPQYLNKYRPEDLKTQNKRRQR